MKTEDSGPLSRRGMLTGLGALGGVAALGLPTAAEASTPRGNGARRPEVRTAGLPTPIASAPVTSAVNGSRAIGVHASKTKGKSQTDFIVDLSGYLV